MADGLMERTRTQDQVVVMVKDRHAQVRFPAPSSAPWASRMSLVVHRQAAKH